MYLRKSKSAASMTGYAVVLGLISVVAITALQNTGEKTDDLFNTAGDKLAAVSSGSGDNGGTGNTPPDEPTNIVLVDSIMTNIEGTSGNDLFIILGENAGASGPQKTYTDADITNANGGFDVSAQVALSEVNNRTSSSLNPSAVFNTNGGTDNLLIFGNVDLTNINSQIFDNVFLNSGISVSASTPIPANSVIGKDATSYVEFNGGAGAMPEGVMTNVSTIKVAPGTVLTASASALSGVSKIEGEGTILITGAPDMSGIDISNDVVLMVNGEAVLRGDGTVASPFEWSNGVNPESCEGYVRPEAGFNYDAVAKGDGIYKINTSGVERTVSCDMTTEFEGLVGGWTLCANGDTFGDRSYDLVPNNPVSGNFIFCHELDTDDSGDSIVATNSGYKEVYTPNGDGSWGTTANGSNMRGPNQLTFNDNPYFIFGLPKNVGAAGFTQGGSCGGTQSELVMATAFSHGGAYGYETGCHSGHNFNGNLDWQVWSRK